MGVGLRWVLVFAAVSGFLQLFLVFAAVSGFLQLFMVFCGSFCFLQRLAASNFCRFGTEAKY